MRAEHLCECVDPLWPLHPCSQPDLERSARSTIICPNGIGKTVAAEPPLLADSAALGAGHRRFRQLAVGHIYYFITPESSPPVTTEIACFTAQQSPPLLPESHDAPRPCVRCLPCGGSSAGRR